MSPVDNDIETLETLCSEEYGPQEVVLFDRYDFLFTVEYHGIESVPVGTLPKILDPYSGSWKYCSDNALLRLLPEMLRMWRADLLKEMIAWQTGDFACTIYSILHQRQLLRRQLPCAVKQTATDVVNQTLLERVGVWSVGLEDEMPIGGDSIFAHHWNSCIAILESAQPLWESFWRLDAKGVVLEAIWFIQTFAGGNDEQQVSIVDTRDFSHHLISNDAETVPFWSDETVRFLLEDGRFESTLDELTDAIENDLFGLRQCKAWPAISATLVNLRDNRATIVRRFALYVNLMHAGQSDWRAWQEVECGQ